MSWTIKGEAGASLDETERDLAELNFSQAKLVFQSLGSDFFEWESATENATGEGTIIPDIGQLVEIFCDGIRRFRGHCTIPRITSKSAAVTLEGPWWWLMRIPLTQEQADGEATISERPSYVFPTQRISTSIESLIDRAIENGAPMVKGTITEAFSFPKITLSEMSCGQALAELLSVCPDAVIYFDYTGTGLPSINLCRRGSMTARTFRMGTDDVEDIDIYPRLELEVARVAVASVGRAPTTGLPQWASQESGPVTVGKSQLIVVSGPEVNAFLPKDKFDQVDLLTFEMPTGGMNIEDIVYGVHTANAVTGAAKDFVLSMDPNIATMIREFGSTFSDCLYLSNGGRFYTSGSTNGQILTGEVGFNTDKMHLISVEATAGLYVVASSQRIPEWLATENGLTLVQATLTGWVRMTRPPETTAQDWWSDAVDRAGHGHVGYPAGTTTASLYYQRSCWFPFSIPVQLINVPYETLTTVYRQWDFDYVSPPSDLAENLLLAQNWTPWQGSIRTVADAVNGAQDLNLKYHVANALPSCAEMGALSHRLEYDIARGRKTIQLGAPPRVDFGTLASRFRRHPKDNITYL